MQTLILGSAKEALSVASWPEPSVAGAPTERTVGRRAIPLPCSSATFLSPLCYTFAPSLTLQQIVASALAWEKRKRGGATTPAAGVALRMGAYCASTWEVARSRRSLQRKTAQSGS